jgi:hypothetical protein
LDAPIPSASAIARNSSRNSPWRSFKLKGSINQESSE